MQMLRSPGPMRLVLASVRCRETSKMQKHPTGKIITASMPGFSILFGDPTYRNAQHLIANKMGRKLVGGNWKLMCDQRTLEMLKELHRDQFDAVDAFIAVPYIYISHAMSIFPSYIAVGAQDVSAYEEGPYTGEVSAAMLKEQGVQYVLVGHSERRLHFGEGCVDVYKKLQRCLDSRLRPVLCIGESGDCRKAKGHLRFLKNQLQGSVGSLTNIELDVAYEPVWAIGGDETASHADITEVAEHIRGWMDELKLQGRILYGGAVSVENICELVAIGSIDGVLAGCTSLSAEFGQIARRMSGSEGM